MYLFTECHQVVSSAEPFVELSRILDPITMVGIPYNTGFRLLVLEFKKKPLRTVRCPFTLPILLHYTEGLDFYNDGIACNYTWGYPDSRETGLRSFL